MLEVALAWQPATSRAALGALFRLDARLRAAVLGAREPLLAQMRLAWWREQLTAGPGAAPGGEPLLALLSAAWGGPTAPLAALVDGWEERLGEAPQEAGALERFAWGRGTALAAFARTIDPGGQDGSALAGRRWALAELAARAIEPTERDAARRLLQALDPPARLPRALRGLAVLDGLAARAADRGEPLLANRRAALAAIRLGLLGR